MTGSVFSPAAALSRLWAVAVLTFTEAIRRKIFLVVILVGVAVVGSAAFFPAVDPPGRLRLIEIWSIRTVTFFCSLGAILLAGFSLPSDIEQRRIYMLVTKPVHKGTLFLGKLLGFTLLMAVFLAIMGVLTLAYIRVVAALTPGFPTLAAYPRHEAARFSGEGVYLTSGTTQASAVRSDQDGRLRWTFRSIPRRGLGENVRGSLKLDLWTSREGGPLEKDLEPRLEADVALTATNPETREEHDQTIQVQTNRAKDIAIPSRCVSSRGEVDIAVRPAESDLVVAGRPDGLGLYSGAVGFELNFLLGFSLILFQGALVMMLTLAASTFVSAPVSILLGLTLLFLGSSWSFVTESVKDVDTALEEVRRRQAEGAPVVRTPENLPPWVLEASSSAARIALQAVPDFDRFSPAERLLTDTAIPARDVQSAGLAFASRGAVLILLGLILITLRDFAT